MTFVTIKTLTPHPLLLPTLQSKNPNSRLRVSLPKTSETAQRSPNSEIRTERGLEFEIGDSFFRHESATGRDLGVLAASIHKKSTGGLRVLDAMCGCGVRSLRYLAEAEADFVLANDANYEIERVILSNLSQVSGKSGDEGRWAVTHSDANRIMAEHYLKKDFFDLIDIDSFGSDSSFLRSAFSALKLGGLLYVTSTDGFSAGGHRPQHSLASYGAYVRPMPYANEVGLRMLIGGAVREASVLGYYVSPLFSYYSYHGPVFRVMLRVNRGKLPQHRSLVVSGPLWTGPLHDKLYIEEMLAMAVERGWSGTSTPTHLDKLLKLMLDESDPRLPCGIIKIDEVASRAKVNSPPLRTVLDWIQKEGFAASRSHITSNAIKTNCPMADCISIAKRIQQR